MAMVTIVCARCTLANHMSERFCSDCGLPLGSLQPDAEAACEALSLTRRLSQPIRTSPVLSLTLSSELATMLIRQAEAGRSSFQ